MSRRLSVSERAAMPKVLRLFGNRNLCMAPSEIDEALGLNDGTSRKLIVRRWRAWKAGEIEDRDLWEMR